uniref:Protein kinase domain-containing protein n=2 Tax=Gadus morhua TaxID=8049 RepID=A0A8C5B2I0_GADMO
MQEASNIFFFTSKRSDCCFNQMIHRDVKPDNVLVSRSGVVKLADFGCARLSGGASLPRTSCEGTLWFMAPEVLVKDPSYTTSVDVWALGCTIAFMATGKPFLMGTTVRCQIEEVIMKVGPLTDHQEQQYYAYQRFPVEPLPKGNPPSDLFEKYNTSEPLLTQLMELCLAMDPVDRWSCSKMLGHPYFTADHFHESFSKELKEMVDQDQSAALMVDPDQSAALMVDQDQSAALMVDPDQSAALMVDPDQSDALMVDPDQSAALMVDPDQSAALMVDQDQSAALMVDPDQSAALMVDPDHPQNPGSLPDLSSATQQPPSGMPVEEERCSPDVKNAWDGDDEDTGMGGCFPWTRRKDKKEKPKGKGIRNILRSAVGAFRRQFLSRVAPMV